MRKKKTTKITSYRIIDTLVKVRSGKSPNARLIVDVVGAEIKGSTGNQPRLNLTNPIPRGNESSAKIINSKG